METYSVERTGFPCVICRGTSFDVFYQKDISVATSDGSILFQQELEACRQCGLIRQFPNGSYSAENLDRFYKYAYRTPLEWNELQSNDPRLKNAEERLEFVESLGVGRTLLEIGFGDGVFLLQAKNRNYDCTGIDPSTGYHYINQELVDNGINIVSCRFDDCPKSRLGKNSAFDVICIFLVLEHITYPLAFLEKALKLMKPNGRLVIEVPDVTMYPKFISETILTFEHVYHYSLESLENLLQKLNCCLTSKKSGGVSYGHSFLSAFERSEYSEKIIWKTDNIEHFGRFLVERDHYLRHLFNIITKLIEKRNTHDLRLGIYGVGFFANVLVSSCGLSEEAVDYIFDDTPEKIDSYYLGKRISHIDAIEHCDIQMLMILSESFCEQLINKVRRRLNGRDLEIYCPHSSALSMLE